MSQFKTQAEIWQALISGISILHKDWKEKCLHIKLVDGFTKISDESNAYYSFRNPGDWRIYETVKRKKILKPFLIRFESGGVGSNFYENEEQAKHCCVQYNMIFLGPAKGIPDQEVEA